LPDRIANAPELPQHLEWYITAFYDLTNDRQSGFGEGPIPITSVLTYAKYYELDSYEVDDLWFFIRQLDAAYLKYVEKKNKPKTEKKKKK
jgi:hypothetical protein